jgi:hypothetical protein
MRTDILTMMCTLIEIISYLYFCSMYVTMFFVREKNWLNHGDLDNRYWTEEWCDYPVMRKEMNITEWTQFANL